MFEALAAINQTFNVEALTDEFVETNNLFKVIDNEFHYKSYEVVGALLYAFNQRIDSLIAISESLELRYTAHLLDVFKRCLTNLFEGDIAINEKLQRLMKYTNRTRIYQCFHETMNHLLIEIEEALDNQQFQVFRLLIAINELVETFNLSINSHIQESRRSTIIDDSLIPYKTMYSPAVAIHSAVNEFVNYYFNNDLENSHNNLYLEDAVLTFIDEEQVRNQLVLNFINDYAFIHKFLPVPYKLDDLKTRYFSKRLINKLKNRISRLMNE